MPQKGLIFTESWGHLGALVATRNDTEQAEFFKGFIKELKSFETNWQADMQLTYIAKHLSDDDKSYLSPLTYRGE